MENSFWKIKRIFLLISLITIHQSLITRQAHAVCPVCTVAVGAGLGLSRWLGIDDLISGIWTGGLLMSLSVWSADWLKRKTKFAKPYKKPVLTALSFSFWSLITFIPLWTSKIIGDPFNTLLGIDKLIFGSFLGVFIFIFSVWADKKVRKVRGKQLFQYQKVVFPVVSLVITSLLIYYYGGYLY